MINIFLKMIIKPPKEATHYCKRNVKEFKFDFELQLLIPFSNNILHKLTDIICNIQKR